MVTVVGQWLTSALVTVLELISISIKQPAGLSAWERRCQPVWCVCAGMPACRVAGKLRYSGNEKAVADSERIF